MAGSRSRALRYTCCLPVILSAAKHLRIFLGEWRKSCFHTLPGFFAEFTLSEMKRILRCAQDDKRGEARLSSDVTQNRTDINKVNTLETPRSKALSPHSRRNDIALLGWR